MDFSTLAVDDPRDWRGRPSDARLAWVVDVAGGGRVRRIRRLSGGRAMATDAVTIEAPDGSLRRFVLRRWARPGWRDDDPDFTADREAAVLERLSAIGFERLAGVAIPRVVAADADGVVDGDPVLLLTMLPGRPRPRARPLGAAAVRRLAEVLVAINAIDDGLRAIASTYAPFASVAEVRPPIGTAAAGLWERAIELCTVPPATTRSGFMHRDYHPGNALWDGDRLTAILDWTQASWGPLAADLGHLRVNLAADHSVALADAARDAYLMAGGRADAAAWWDVRALLDWLPDLDPAYASGPGLARLERYLASLLEAF